MIEKIIMTYSDIIKYQNHFLKPLLNNANKEYLNIYTKQIKKDIIV